jgi:hypothetical protein
LVVSVPGFQACDGTPAIMICNQHGGLCWSWDCWLEKV